MQSKALEQARELKLQSLENKIAQQQLKIKTEEIDLAAANNELQAYQRQIDAARIMYDSGAISLTELEKRKINYQNRLAKWNSSGNKLQQSRQELTNLRIEQQASLQEYADIKPGMKKAAGNILTLNVPKGWPVTWEWKYHY